MNYMIDIVNQFLHAEVMSYCYKNLKLFILKFHNLASLMDCQSDIKNNKLKLKKTIMNTKELKDKKLSKSNS